MKYIVRSSLFKTDNELEKHLNECYLSFGHTVVSVFKDGNFYTIVALCK